MDEPRTVRPTPLHGEVESWPIDYATWKRRALADGRIEEHETVELMTAIETRMPRLTLLCRTVRTIHSMTGGRDGIASHRAVRSFAEFQRRRTDQGPEAA